MIKLTLNNPNGQKETIDLSKHDIYSLLERFRDNGIEGSPFEYKVGEARQEGSSVSMTKEIASEQLTFYCPLEGHMCDAEDGYYYDTDNSVLLDHSDSIEEYLKREQSPDVDMAEYVGNHSGIGEKLLFAEWSVEEISGTLYGRIDCYLSEPISPDETEKLRDAIQGQNSDGFGEGLRMRTLNSELLERMRIT